MSAKSIVHVLACAALMLAPAAFAQAPAAPMTAAEKNDRDRVIVTGKPTRKTLYGFYRQLDGNGVCPGGVSMPRGHSCAELTYDVFDASGKFLRRCNVPLFRVVALRQSYVAMTYRRFDCSNPEKWSNQDLAIVPLEEILDPRTKDGTRLKTVSVLGFYQARELCELSKEQCVTEVFDHTSDLSFKSLKQLWDGPSAADGGLGAHGH